MSWPKGKPRPDGAGRKKGTLNKATVAVKEMLRAALDEAGGKEYLVTAAREEPKAFLALIGKLIPNEVVATVDLSHKLEIVDLSDEVK